MTESLQAAYRQELSRHHYRPPSVDSWNSTRQRLSGTPPSPAGQGEADAIRAILDGTPPVNAEIIPLAAQVEKGASEWADMMLPYPVLCRACPDADYNAEARESEDGALLLINEGLIFFTYHCLEIWVQTDRLPEVFGTATLGDEEAMDLLAHAVVAFHRGMEALGQRGEVFPFVGGQKGHLLTELSRGALRFVVGHEYGHVYAGHLMGPPHHVAARASGLEEIPPHWLEEYRADLLAMRTIYPPSMRTARANAQGIFRLSGPLIFIALGEFIERVSEIVYLEKLGRKASSAEFVEMTERSTHPPLLLRGKHYRNWVQSIRAGHLTFLGERFAAWIDDRLEQLVPETARRLLNQERR